MTKMTDEEILAKIRAYAPGGRYAVSTLSDERKQAIDFYNGTVDIDPPPGDRSDEVSTDVRDTVEGMLPDLVEIFLGSERIVEFDSTKAVNEAEARQKTDAANYVFYKQNAGALILMEWIKTALLEKNGIVKFYWDERTRDEEESYDLDEATLRAVGEQPDVEIVSVKPFPGAVGMLYQTVVKVRRPAGKVKIESVPPENFDIDSNHRSLSLEECQFCRHREKKTLSDIREILRDTSLEMDDLGGSSNGSREDGPEASARDRYGLDSDLMDKNLVEVEDTYIRVDADGDGIDELRRVVVIGNKIWINEPIERMPFAAICPVVMPFQFYGMSIADLVMDVQRTKSKILRAQLDSLYLAIAPRTAIMESMCNLNDLLVQRPGGVVRFKGPPGPLMEQMTVPFVGQQAFPMMEYQDSLKENRTGWTRYSQGLDAGSLNKTATGVSIISSAAQKRLRLIARMFAETGVRDLFIGIIWLLSKHQEGPLCYRLRGDYVEVDPRQWKTQFDVTVNVGIGHKDVMQTVNALQMLGQFQSLLVKELGKGHLVHDSNFYNTGMLLAEAAGYKQEGQFFTAPGPNNQPPPPQPPPEIIKQDMVLKADAQKTAASQQHEGLMQQAKSKFTESLEDKKTGATLQAEQIKAEADIMKTRMTLESQERIANAKMQADAIMAQQQLAVDREVRMEEARLNAEAMKERDKNATAKSD